MLHFVGIGAQKCGTTWLYRVLKRHPELDFPAGKEVHFWDQKIRLGIDWYKNLFLSDATHLAGEITPAYAILEHEQIRDCRYYFPDIRLIYIVRNPIERAWSAALMALARAEMRPDEASDQWFLDHFHSLGSVRRGDYEACLKKWYEHYPAQQLLVQRFDLLIKTPRTILTNVCDHLGVNPEPLTNLDDNILKLKTKPVETAQVEGIRPSLLPTLREVYYPKIKSLAHYLDQNLDTWFI